RSGSPRQRGARSRTESRGRDRLPEVLAVDLVEVVPGVGLDDGGAQEVGQLVGEAVLRLHPPDSVVADAVTAVSRISLIGRPSRLRPSRSKKSCHPPTNPGFHGVPGPPGRSPPRGSSGEAANAPFGSKCCVKTMRQPLSTSNNS